MTVAAGVVGVRRWRRGHRTRTPGLWLLVVAVSVAVVLTGWFLGLRSGLLRSDLSGTGIAWSQNPATRAASISFSVTNDGWSSTTVTGVDGSAPGMGRPVVTVSMNQGGTDERLPVTLARHAILFVHIAYRHVDCRSIRSTGSTTIPVHATSRLGYSTTVGVPLGQFLPRTPAGRSTTMSERALSWSAGVTSLLCAGRT